MAHVLNDRVKETTTTTGTGTVNLAGAETGFESFVAGIGNSNTTYYCIVHQSADEFEVGIGTVTDASPDTLSRTTIISSSNSDSAVNFSAGTKDVFCTLPASKTVFFDETSGGSDVAIGSRGTNPMGLGITGTVLALTEQNNVASLQIDGNTGTRIDMGTQGSRNAVFYTDANQLEISRTTDHPIKFVVNSSEVARFVSTELKLASGKKLVGGASSVDLTIQSEHRTQIQGASKGTVLLNDSGTVYGLFERPTSTNDFDIQNPISDGDITFVGNDGGSTITALTLDMSDAGRAIFNGSVDIGGTSITKTGDLTVDVSGDITLDAGGDNIKFHDSGTEVGQIDLGSQNLTIRSSVSDKDMIFRVNDGGTEIVALTIDASAAGAATFNDNVTAYSDERLKDNIETIENGLDKVEQLRGVTYTRDEKESIGVIAQEVEKILPEIVLTADDEMGTKSVDYGRLTAVLIEAVKDLSARVKELENK